jgi:two-component system sensor histidine kinase BarA
LEVDTVQSGKDAIKIIKENLDKQFYKMILMDLNMPHMDGIQTTKEVRNIMNEKELDCKILLHTASDIAANDPVLMSLFDGVVDKPLNLKNLFDVFESFDLSRENK